MRLDQSRSATEERILACLNEGYALSRMIFADYTSKKTQATFNPETDLPLVRKQLADWINGTYKQLRELFPTELEANLFAQQFSVSASDYLGTNQEIGQLVYSRIPRYIDRLHKILEVHVPRYGDLPASERLFVEDIDSFAKVRDVNPALTAPLLKKGRIDLSEDFVQQAIERILSVPFHRRDWGGETNDLYTANIVLNGRRRATAFLLKGNGLRTGEMKIRDCGKNGDQVVRLFQSPAELFVLQFVGPISDQLIEDVRGKTLLRRAQGANANFVIIDGQDTARLLMAYGQLSPARPA